LVLCSGYIYEPDRGYSILDDQLLNAIVRGTAGYHVQTLAGKLQQSGTMDWLGYYRNFVATLRDAGIQVEPHIAPERNWHAKVAVRFDTTGQPRAAIVGGSNLTGPAYRERRRNPRQNFRYVCGLLSEPYPVVVAPQNCRPCLFHVGSLILPWCGHACPPRYAEGFCF
jgi:hypothetical protein